jgi:hypothetical protein
MKYWEMIADRLSKAGWSLGWVLANHGEGRTIWIVEAHGYGNRFVVRADEKLTAFLGLEFPLAPQNDPAAYQARPYMKIKHRLT